MWSSSYVCSGSNKFVLKIMSVIVHSVFSDAGAHGASAESRVREGVHIFS